LDRSPLLRSIHHRASSNTKQSETQIKALDLEFPILILKDIVLAIKAKKVVQEVAINLNGKAGEDTISSEATGHSLLINQSLSMPFRDVSHGFLSIQN
jgi:hypothetical protein